jgi:hypothetical protein
VTDESHREPLLFDAAASLCTFAVSGAAAALTITGRISLFDYLFVHGACAAFAVAIIIAGRKPPRRQALLHAIMASAIGPVGSAGTFISIMFESAFRAVAQPFEVWFASIFPEDAEDEQEAFLDRLKTSDDPLAAAQSLSSFRDVLTSGTIDQKQAAIALIARRFTPAFAPALRQSLNDPVAAVRVQAAAAAAAIESRYAERSVGLSRAAEAPDAGPEDHRALARHLLEFAESGVTEQQRADEAAEAALVQFERVLATKPRDGEALIASTRLLLRKGDAVKANERVRDAISVHGVTVTTAALQVEVLMRLGRFDDVRRAAVAWSKRIDASDRDGERLLAALSLWTVPHARA